MCEVAPKISSGGLHFDLVGELLQSVNSFGGFMTGSAVIGGFRSDSDIDVAFPIYNAQTVDKMLTIQSTKLGFVKSQINATDLPF